MIARVSEGGELVPKAEAHIELPADALPEPIADALEATPADAQPTAATPARTQTRPGQQGQLASEKVVISAPLSLTGSTQRIWKLTKIPTSTGAQVAVIVGVIPLLLLAWTVVVAWYIGFGILLVPYRLLRRGSRKRKRKRQALQHREMMDAIQQRREPDRP